jgi:hypothetical protein
MVAFFRYDFEQEKFILIGYHRERSKKKRIPNDTGHNRKRENENQTRLTGENYGWSPEARSEA